MNFFAKIPKELIFKKEFLTNEIIFNKNNLCSSICYIKRGKIAKIKGKKIIEVYNQHSIIGIDLIFSSYPFYDENFKALELTSLDLVTKEGLINSNIILDILEFYSNELLELKEHSFLLSIKSNEDKILYFLLTEYKKKSSTSFVIDMTKSELSNYLNIDKNELSNIICKLINDKIIANKNKLYTLINLEFFLSL